MLLSVYLSVRLYPKWLNPVQICCGTSHDPGEALKMLRITKFVSKICCFCKTLNIHENKSTPRSFLLLFYNVQKVNADRFGVFYFILLGVK